VSWREYAKDNGSEEDDDGKEEYGG